MNYFINRELSWLKFNKRVLEQSRAPEVPVFERQKFVSIFTSNLDEFFMVRVGSLRDMALLGDDYTDNKTGMTPLQQLEAIYRDVRPLYALRDNCQSEIEASLRDFGLIRLDIKNLTPPQTKFVKQYFKREILPLVSPQIIDAKHPFPHLENKRLYVMVSLKHNGKYCCGIIPVSSVFERIIAVPDENHKDGFSYLLVEDVLLKFAGDIFKQFGISGRSVVRITRNADVEVEDNFSDDDVDYRDYVKVIIKRREKLSPVRVETYSGSYSKSDKLGRYLTERAGLAAAQCYFSKTPLDMSYAFRLEEKLPAKTAAKAVYTPLYPQNCPDISPLDNVFATAMERDIFLSYPYYSMRPYLKLLEEAADDPDTVSIKITLYRMSNNSEVVSLLCRAAENGHEVTAVVELKARFDENNNIGWSERLEEAGCRVVYGIDSLKVHSKITLITKKSGETISCVAHIATGNYNEKTAKLYTDVGIITSDEKICSDAVDFFQNLTLGIPDGDYSCLLVAPHSLKSGIIDEIHAEKEKAASGQKAYIRMKMNSLTDKEIIDELVDAAKSGVKIDLIIRGICCLRPGIVGETDNIRVVSIVGRFLEHSRIFIFGDDPSKRRTYFGSADLMTRNTTRRIEIIAPVFDRAIAGKMFEMTELMLADNVKQCVLCSSGEYERAISDSKPLDSQYELYMRAYEEAGKSAKVGK